VNKCNDKEDAVLPIDTGIIIWITNVDNRCNELCKAKIRRCNGNYRKDDVNTAVDVAFSGKLIRHIPVYKL
jgi:hypothetical protein